LIDYLKSNNHQISQIKYILFDDYLSYLMIIRSDYLIDYLMIIFDYLFFLFDHYLMITI